MRYFSFLPLWFPINREVQFLRKTSSFPGRDSRPGGGRARSTSTSKTVCVLIDNSGGAPNLNCPCFVAIDDTRAPSLNCHCFVAIDDTGEPNLNSPCFVAIDDTRASNLNFPSFLAIDDTGAPKLNFGSERQCWGARSELLICFLGRLAMQGRQI